MPLPEKDTEGAVRGAPASGESPEATVRLKAPEEIPSDSLRKPSDPDAGYDSHKGKGFQAQPAETCDPYGGKDGKKGLSLLLYSKAEGAHRHDGSSLVPAVKELKDKGLGPLTMIATLPAAATRTSRP